MGRYRSYRRSVLGKVLLVLAGVALICGIGILVFTRFFIEPNLERVAGMRAETVVSRTINKALAEHFSGADMQEQLFTVGKDESGAINMVQADSMEINRFMAELSVRLQEYFKKMEKESYSVPLGSLAGSKVLSQIGPNVDLAIIPMSISSMDFRTEFETGGINQTKYKIYIEMECRIKVLAPFSSKLINTGNTILVAEAVILGDVPNSYVEVPKEDILDVIDE